MSLISRISLTGSHVSAAEDFLSEGLALLDSDDAPNIHGDAEHGLCYTSPRLPKPLFLDLADPAGAEDLNLFGHYLWNSSLVLAELVEAASLGADNPSVQGRGTRCASHTACATAGFDIRGSTTLELGAGTALPSLLTSLLGAAEVAITDYPAPVLLDTLRGNVARNLRPEHSPSPFHSVTERVTITGHEWGELGDAFATSKHHAFDRIFVADCLWMPRLHSNLLKSISWFLKDTAEARVCIVAGFHTGRDTVAAFFDAGELGCAGLEIECRWETDVDGAEREWVDDRGEEGMTGRKRWLVVALLRRRPPKSCAPTMESIPRV